MIHLLILNLVLPLFFNSDLQTETEVLPEEAIGIIIDDIYCKDCLESIFKLSYLWREDYKTFLLIRSSRKKESIRFYINAFKKNTMIDRILFFEKSRKDIFPQFSFGSSKLSASPALLIINNNSRNLIHYNEMFAVSIDTVKIKNHILKKIK